jgi:hypothetical protein
MGNPPEPGIVYITFDAGGAGSSVNSNPQYFAILDQDKGTFGVEWILNAPFHTCEGYSVEIGNVVPCRWQDISEGLSGYDFRSKPVPAPETGLVNGWSWTFQSKNDGSRQSLEILQGQIDYEVFLYYRHELDLPEKRRLVRLRSSAPLDPSLILPPKQSGPGMRPKKR